MATVNELTLNSAFASSLIEGRRNMNAEGKLKNYARCTLRNLSTGESEEVRLFDPQDEHNEDLLAFDAHHELKADLRAALDTFSSIEKRIILRVLLQGQSIQEATKRSKTPLRTWQRWMAEVAIPRLRSLLADYADTLRTFPYESPITSSEKPEREPEEIVSCKVCGDPFVGRGEKALGKLRAHYAAKHREVGRKIQLSLRDSDAEIFRLSSEAV